MKKYKVIVEKNEKISSDLYLLRLKFREGTKFNFKAGQYIMVDLFEGGDLVSTRAYSIASSPYDTRGVDLCIKRIPGGKVSNYLCDLKVGDAVKIRGPLGAFTLSEPQVDSPVFIGAGTGIAPLRGMILKLVHDNFDKEMWLFFGERTQKDLIYRDEFEKIQKENKNFHFIPVISREKWCGEMGHVQDVIPKYIKDGKGREAYICGMIKMVEEVNDLLLSIGFSEKKIHHEKY